MIIESGLILSHISFDLKVKTFASGKHFSKMAYHCFLNLFSKL